MTSARRSQPKSWIIASMFAASSLVAAVAPARDFGEGRDRHAARPFVPQREARHADTPRVRDTVRPQRMRGTAGERPQEALRERPPEVPRDRPQDASRERPARPPAPVPALPPVIERPQVVPDAPGRPGRLTPDERRALRQQINDAGRDVYRPQRP